MVARWRDDPRTLDAIMSLSTDDQVWDVRSTAVMKLLEFDPAEVEATARRALEDEHQDARWSARPVAERFDR